MMKKRRDDYQNGGLRETIISMRPKQWTKNLIIFAALVFSGNLFVMEKLVLSLIGFGVFSLLSGALYIVNDVVDSEFDRAHPRKQDRPIAAGKLSTEKALLFACIVAAASVVLSLRISFQFGAIVLFYAVIQLVYSLCIKNIVILDVFSISLGFVVRLIAGAVVIAVEISSWFLICTLLICLFLALCKRRSERLHLLRNHAPTRKVLRHYSARFLDQAIALVGSATVVSYAFYTFSSETVAKFHTKNLIYTVPFVLYAMIRYLYLIYEKKAGEEPELLLVSDMPLLVSIMVFFFIVVGVIYL